MTGQSTYVDDIQPHGLAYVAILRSVYAHATITAIDTSAAAAHPGVIAVYSGAAFRDMVEPMPHGGEGAVPPDMTPIATPVLAHGRVRHVGEPIAVVVADDRYVARDALDLIEVDYEPLEAAVDLDAAVAPDAPQLYDDVPGNVAYTWTCKHGDPDAAFGSADVTVRQRLVNQRLAGVAMEPRGVLMQPDALSGGLVVITSTQNPHTVRREIAATLRLPEIAVRVIAPEVGGGFGVKISSYPEDMICAVLTLRLNRPVKWIETRGESLSSTHHGRAQVADVELAARRDGTIPPLTGWLMCGVYKYDAVDLDIHAVYTNTMAVGAYRGAGRRVKLTSATFAKPARVMLCCEVKLPGAVPIQARRRPSRHNAAHMKRSSAG